MKFGKQSKIGAFTTDHKFAYDLIMFNKYKRLDALLPPSINPITSLWVYSDIIELSAVGDTQASILGYLLIQSKFDEMGYWNFNPPYNIEIKEHSVSNITIKI